MNINNVQEFFDYVNADVNFPDRHLYIGTYSVFRQICAGCRKSTYHQSVQSMKNMYKDYVLKNQQYIRNSLQNKKDKEIKFYLDNELFCEININ
jgi:hypothetical protein